MKNYEYLNDCPFCDIENKNLPVLPESLNLYNDSGLRQKTLYSDDYFNVISDISPLVDFHFLIISKKHFFSMANQDENYSDALDIVKNKVKMFYKNKLNKNAIFYEHGNCSTHKSSACVNHAHLHSLPVSESEERDIISYSQRILGQSVSKEFILSKNYLFLDSSFSYSTYWSDDKSESQIFRRLISDVLQIQNRTTWQQCIIYSDEREISKARLKLAESVKL